MTVAIVGYATEGIVSARYWHDQGHDITVCDQDSDLDIPAEFHQKTGAGYIDGLDVFDIVVRSAGIHPRVLLKKNPEIESKITTNVEEFMRVCPSRNIIGVTGTKGKGTTSTLIAKMLQAAGKTTHLGGNIGIAALELLPAIKADDWVVLELSSFQLEDFKGPAPHIAVCLMVVPEHLNWHASMQEYITAKSHLFAPQMPSDIAIYYGHNDISKTIASVGQGRKMPYCAQPGADVVEDFVKIDGKQICHVSELKLLGKHIWQNVCAAVTAAWQVTQDIAAIKSVLTSFGGLEHRIEFTRELDNVRYYDDSFATTPETAIAAIEAFEQPKVLILGGSDKGIPLDPIADVVAKKNVRHVIAIGDTATVIAEQLRAQGFENITLGLQSMPEIVHEAQQHAQSGDVVLLSTGCASFGLFQDYKDRGNQFKSAVQALL